MYQYIKLVYMNMNELSILPLFSQALQSEALVMEEELCRLRSQAELHRMQTTVIATLEGERATLERERETLRNTVDAIRTAQRKVEEHTCTKTHIHINTNTCMRCSCDNKHVSDICPAGRWMRGREKEIHKLNE